MTLLSSIIHHTRKSHAFVSVIILLISILSGPTGQAQKTNDGLPCPGHKFVTDYDGNRYGTVKIGTQCWMKENLHSTHYANGDTILLSNGGLSYMQGYRYELQQNDTLPAECFYNWQAATRGLHSKSTPSNVQGVCPKGWHLPSQGEWENLIEHINSSDFKLNSNKLYIGKALASQTGWISTPDTFAIGNHAELNDGSGFTAIPVGSIFENPAGQGIAAEFWSSTITNYGSGYYLYLHSYLPYAALNASDQREGRSVRCVLDGPKPATAATPQPPTNPEDIAMDGQPCPGYEIVTDIDKNEYKTVQIGQQCWMQENLRTTHFANGKEIKLGKEKNNTIAYRYAPNDTMKYVEQYGYLYNWNAAMNGAKSSSTNPSNVQGICPDGWHLPSLAEWHQLTDYVLQQPQYQPNGDKNDVDRALSSSAEWKPTSYIHESTKSGHPNTGFNALPAGLYEGYYDGFGEDAYFWSATTQSKNLTYFFAFGNSAQANYHYYYYNGNGFSVRCVKD